MVVPIGHVLVVSLLMFGIGLVGVLTRRNVIVVLMSVELILNAANLNFVAFARLNGDLVGQIFSIFTITIAAAEVAVGLAILIAFFRNRQTVDLSEVDLMKG
jgi:NADH-quinone oxidoreductase subunit K